MPPLRYAVELRVFLVHKYLKYESATQLGRQVFRKRHQEVLQLQPCKATVVRAWKEHDPVVRIHFGNWFLQSVYEGEVIQLLFSTNEGWFPYVER
jgi:hypothetical protein